MNKQIRRLALVLGVLFALIFLNLNWVQVVRGDSYRNHAGNRRVLLAEYADQRGQIVVDGSSVATSKATDDELKFLRVYPQGPEYSAVTGYYSYIYDRSGMEQAADSLLSGTDNRLFGTRLADLLTGRNSKGGSVELTLSKDAQDAAYQAMSKAGARGAVVALDPSTGAILAAVSTPAFDPNKLASHDSQVQTAYWASLKADTDPDTPLLNRAFNQTYPAGSTFKLITSAAVLKTGIKPGDKVPALRYYWPDQQGSGSCTVNGVDSGGCIHNFSVNGVPEECQPGSDTATLTFALAKSCNTAFAALAVQNVGAQGLAEQARAFGLDDEQRQIPLTVAASTYGSLDVISNDAVALAQTAFGQRDVRVTPLQDAMLSAAIANDGTLMQPYLVRKELAPNLSPLSVTTPSVMSQAVDSSVAAQLRTMMHAVVTEPEGTGLAANITGIPGVEVGGKTGTADTGFTSADSAEPDNWFTGYAMQDGKPAIALAVVIENSNELKLGGALTSTTQAASQVARAVMSAYLKAGGAN